MSHVLNNGYNKNLRVTDKLSMHTWIKTNLFQHIDAETKLIKFCRWHFETTYSQIKNLYFISNFAVLSEGHINKSSFIFVNGSVTYRPQAIIWVNDDWVN